MIRVFFFVVTLLSANLSFAGETDFPKTFMGRYVVSDVSENDHFRQGTLCKPYIDENGNHQEPDFRCGQSLLVFKDEARGEIAMFLAPQSNRANGKENLFNFSVFRSALLAQNRKCQAFINIENLSNLFESNVCRGFR